MEQRRHLRPLSVLARVCYNRQNIHRDSGPYRPVVYETEEEWQWEKRRYIQSVNRHLDENSSGASDAVTEMMNLMTHVADQNPGRLWQHPSDLTCRNYINRSENRSQKMSLEEWQMRNDLTYRRFASVPDTVERSPYRKSDN